MKSQPKENAKNAKPGKEQFDGALKLWDADDIEGAIVEFKKAMSLGFKKDSVENDLGACYERIGNAEEARNHYIAALEANPDNFYALKNMAELLSSEGKWDEAKKLFQKTFRIDSDDSGAILGFARSMIATNEIEKATKLLVRKAKDNKDKDAFIDFLRILNDIGAHEEIVKISEYAPEGLRGNDEAQTIIGKGYLEVGLSAEAVARLQKVYDRNPTAEVTSWLGLALISSGLEEVGIEMLKRSVEQDPANVQLLRNYSFALHGSDMLEDSLSVYERAIALEPDDWVLWNNWGNALYNLGRYVESLPKFVTAIERNPDYEIAWNNIGNALEKMHLYAESLPFHERAIEIDEDFDYAHYASAMGLTMIGRSKEAKKALNRSMSMFPRFPEAWMLKARMMLRASPEEAIVYAMEAVNLDPGSAEPLIILAMCQAMAGQLAESEMTLRHAREAALAGDDRKAVKEVDHLMSGGPENYSGIIRTTKEGSRDAVLSYDQEFGDALQWYKIGSELYAQGKRKKALNALKLAHSIDKESVAVVSMLLRAETDKARLKEFLKASEELASKGLATPHLQRSVELARKRMGGKAS